MTFPKRKTVRLQHYDYSQNGAYFVTICTHNRQSSLSNIRRGGALLLPLGKICENEILKLMERYEIKIDNYVIMPNHVHMIISINKVRVEQSPTPTIPDIVCAFKSITTKIANVNDGLKGRKIWQRSFHEHVIRGEKEYLKIWEYIDNNPLIWEDDMYYQ